MRQGLGSEQEMERSISDHRIDALYEKGLRRFYKAQFMPES
jgi:hypothetical protein